MDGRMTRSAATRGPLHSVLYMPASNARALQKARSLAADAYILDLEDAVAPAMKDVARRQMQEALAEGGALDGLTTIVRINGLDTPLAEDDLAALAAAPCWPAAVLVPKVSQRSDLEKFAAALAARGAPKDVGLWAMIETPAGIVNLKEIAGSAPETGLECLVVGANDIAKETRLRVKPGRATLFPILSMIVVTARAYDLVVLDAVYNAISDGKGFRAECIEGRDWGFDGKTVIHPSQIAIAREAFAPTAEEIAEAEAIVAAFAQPENAEAGAISLNGQMVERLHLAIAERVLASRR
jgi:citrate lyase subunit beta/citryl-CoA lyase